MFPNVVRSVVISAAAKGRLLERNALGFWLLAALAGVYVGLGMLVMIAVGGMLPASQYPWAKLAYGAVFVVALTLVTMAGSQLFTGNAMTLFMGSYEKAIGWRRGFVVLGITWCGNLLGSIVIAAVYRLAGLVTPGQVAFMTASIHTKTSANVAELLLRGVICNLLVCVAVWCNYKLNSESGKLIVTFWAILTFIVLGGEHSVANMTIFSLGLMTPETGATFLGAVYNLIVVSIGNWLGAVLFLALPYLLSSHHAVDLDAVGADCVKFMWPRGGSLNWPHLLGVRGGWFANFRFRGLDT